MKTSGLDILSYLERRTLGQSAYTDYDTAIKRLKCYDYDEFNGIAPTITNLEPPVFVCKYCCVQNYQHLLALANEDGKIALQDTNLKSKNTFLEGTQAHHNAIFDLAWLETDMKFITASGDHTAVMWDVAEGEFHQVAHFVGHMRSVKCVAVRPNDSAVFATGSRDGSVIIWDSRSNHSSMQCKPDNVISDCHYVPATGLGPPSKSKKYRCRPPSRANSVTGLIFLDDNCVVSCGAGDGLIKAWDLRRNYSAYKRELRPSYTLPYPGKTCKNGFTNLLLDPGKVKLYASCMDNVIYCYNVATFESKPMCEFIGFLNSSFYVKSCLSPDGRYLVSGSSDERAYVWNTRRSGRPLTALVGHSAEVTCVAWSPKGDTKVVTCSDDGHHRIWHVASDHDHADENVELRGWAEDTISPLLLAAEEEALHQSSTRNSYLERTPTSNKRFWLSMERTPESTPNSSSSDHLYCASCGPRKPVTPCSDCLAKRRMHYSYSTTRSVTGTSKRKLDVLLEQPLESETSTNLRLILSPVKCTNSDSVKKIHTEIKVAKQLLNGREKQEIPSSSSQLINEETSENKHSESEMSPSRPDSILSSPTVNLPNFVVDGTSPHHNCLRHPHYKENIDWLTKLRKGLDSVEKSTSPNGPKRRTTRSRSTNEAIKTCSESLLKFFRVVGMSSGEPSPPLCTSTSIPNTVAQSEVDP